MSSYAYHLNVSSIFNIVLKIKVLIKVSFKLFYFIQILRYEFFDLMCLTIPYDDVFSYMIIPFDCEPLFRGNHFLWCYHAPGAALNFHRCQFLACFHVNFSLEAPVPCDRELRTQTRQTGLGCQFLEYNSLYTHGQSGHQPSLTSFQGDWWRFPYLVSWIHQFFLIPPFMRAQFYYMGPAAQIGNRIPVPSWFYNSASHFVSAPVNHPDFESPLC